MTALLSLSSSPQVDPDTCVVSFKGNANVSVSGGNDFWNFFSADRLGVQNTIYESLKPLEALRLMQLDTFALANLIFPSGHKVQMSSVELPTDLTLHGSLVVPLAVHPDRASAAPKQTQQFSVDGGQAVSWAVSPRGKERSAIRAFTPPPPLRLRPRLRLSQPSARMT
jgi:hypothetical protein